MAQRKETDKLGAQRRRWPRRLVGALGVLVILAWAAPIIVSRTPLVGFFARRALADLEGTVRVGGASLGWFSPPVLEDVEVRDGEDGPLLLIPRVVGSRSLLGLLWDSSDLGTFRAERPVFTIVCAHDVTNVEKALAHWMEPAVEASASARPAVRIELVDARVALRDDHAQREWAFEELAGSFSLSADPRAPVQVQVQGGVREGERTGRIDVVLSLEMRETGIQGDFKADIGSFPLASLTPLLRRVEAGLGLAGSLSAQVEGKWGEDADGGLRANLRGEATGRGLGVAGLGMDETRIEHLEASCDVALEGGRLVVRKAEASCDLGKVALAGTFAECADPLAYLDMPGQSLTADLDLPRLTEMLRGLLSVEEDARLTSGKLSLRVAGTPQKDGTGWEGHLRVTDLAGRRGKETVAWQAPVSLDFRLTKAPKKLPLIEECRCDSGFLQGSLAGSAERMTADLSFDLDRLSAQLAPILNLGPVRPGGSGTARAMVCCTAAGGVDVEDCSLTVREARFRGAGLDVNEPIVEVKTSGRWQSDTGRLELKATQVSCATLALDSAGLQLGIAPSGDLKIHGGANVQANLARVQRWLAAPNAVAGILTGRVDLDGGSGGLGVLADLAVNDLVIGNPRDAAWREPRAHLAVRGRLETATDLLKIDEVRFETSVLAGTAAGQLAHLGGSRDLTLSGQLRYDLQQLEPHLRPFLGQGVQVRGQAERPFRLQGPLAALTGEASIGWTSAQAYGCEVGPGDLKTSLGGGWLRVQAVETTVNQGRMRLEPLVRLDPAPAELYLGKGTGVNHFRLTPAACSGALGCALPALANVLEAEGEMSLAIDAARVPLAAPAAAEVSGRIVIHSGRVGPGSLARELGTLLRVPGGASLARESIVPFRMANGRIYHENLELVFPELTVRTRGSVGVDGSLDLLAELPVPPKWLDGKAAKVLGGQPIHLPIRGTLASPKIDEHALRAAMEQAVREAGRDAIRHELDRRLQDLFRPRN